MKMLPFLADSTPFKRETVEAIDMVVLRELTGGIYFGEPQRRWEEDGERKAVDTLAYSEHEVERIVRLGFETARARRGLLTSVDKANILDTSRMWREVTEEIATDYPDVQLEHRLVDACAMDLIRHPAYFDVIVTENLFGDILTDEASMLAGSMGMLPKRLAGRAGQRRHVRADPRHRARHRRAGHRQPLRNDSQRRVDAALLVGPRARGDRDRDRTRRDPRSRGATAPRISSSPAPIRSAPRRSEN